MLIRTRGTDEVIQLGRLLQFRCHCLANSDKFVVGKNINDQQIMSHKVRSPDPHY